MNYALLSCGHRRLRWLGNDGKPRIGHHIHCSWCRATSIVVATVPFRGAPSETPRSWTPSATPAPAPIVTPLGILQRARRLAGALGLGGLW